ncbi:MAG: MBL fold metallo-hydrolase [Chloroflexi bacterium]|nr:MBL fold metallo-hydrolase [Chloroflexota bacterium]
MKLAFLGAATTVTGSRFLLTTDRAKVLVDCGMFQGSPNDIARNHVPFTFQPAELDALLLTHAHLDHCGLIPLLVKRGFRGPIHATRATCELAGLVLLDSGKIQVENAKDRREAIERRARREAREVRDHAADPQHAGHRDYLPRESALASTGEEAAFDTHGAHADPEKALRRQPPEVDTTTDEPLYDVEDAEAALRQFQPIEYDQELEVVPGIRAIFRDAGHILGSAIIQVDAADDDGTPPTRIVFSGDLGRPNTPIIRDPTAILDGADYVLVESTYGGREHEPADEAIRLLAEAVQVTVDHTGVLLIPSFAIGRTQEIVWQLDRLLDAGKIPHVPLYLDSPMASKASDIYRAFPGYYDEETYRLLQAGETPVDYPDAQVTRTADESKAIEFAERPMMIIASNGMLTGGRVVHHLRNLIGDPAAIILFVGYQGQGTMGAHLQGGASEVRINGQWHPVRCQVRSISGFSAHADESELLDWLRHFAEAPRRPRRVFLVHGDPEAEEALAPKIEALGLSAHRPAWNEEVTLD